MEGSDKSQDGSSQNHVSKKLLCKVVFRFRVILFGFNQIVKWSNGQRI
jgi:hypothetical protein